MNKIQRLAVIKEFENYLQENYNEVTQEARFNQMMDTKRQFRADYYLNEHDVIIEINGGQWVSGRHNRGGAGYENDLTKLNLAQSKGFVVYQFTYEMLMNKDYKNYI